MATSSWKTIVGELGTTDVSVSPTALSMIHDANHIFVAGMGRSGLAIQAFAMRIGQLGKPVTVVGEATAPAFTADDLLIVASGSASTQSIVALVQKAKQLGGKSWLLTATNDSDLERLVTDTTILPGKGKFTTKTNTVQPMGSLFEQSVWLFGDAVTLDYMRQYQITESKMQANHANLE
ncbi:SIS domain-containing protein [Nicoliella spurrieriana]|uniref:SIS domain-containing protein n=1 Tax=Nicoliella spurrieriana TaxID=2925830 RepID=A0A976RSC9_9LACO|nr:6-phospho-3-hexuloisomerase [Nicoliella spurrieriana]UQS86929.1 SIS domain-containing protein [Nicoliella spurrieriana]